ncbi:putative NADP oxidoreductase coenzyme F420-dependent protein [Actinacidiphila reveromycinica]|uniref:Putative NADP oxidoreductase coenzyme F420-dependent protein n=1 Tax=Actinacidiphila reveromycinica TaxID=659352 RepID=A0A7U3UW89_9ACTN|nr:NAD(P)-binding domain-containing protein [Streptomyces sp. SN-593]BBA99738.1 putative NADP oxidoreductase coenzyme F420-dependent protein [Streptomyces sp. SN-593]
MRIGILGTGALAASLGGAWVRAGHDVLVGGRSPEKAAAAAAAMGGGAGGGSARAAAAPGEAVAGRDAVLLAVSWAGVPDILRAAGAAGGALAGTVLVDPVNAVDHGVGEHLLTDGRAAAEHIADLAPGAHVVKAFHLFPAARWSAAAASPTGPAGGQVTVPLAGDDEAALRTVGALVADAGARPVTVGPLRRARQLEEAAGLVIALVFAGHDPGAVVPHVPARAAARA